MKTLLTLAIAVGAICAATTAHAAWLNNVPQTVVQPNGDTVHCFASGDEFYHWLHDENGYTIVRDPLSGRFVYQTEASANMPRGVDLTVGVVDPEALGIRPGIRISKDEYLELRERSEYSRPVRTAPKTGLINSPVIFIRFSDQDEFIRSHDRWDRRLNTPNPGSPSARDYFLEASYNQLTIDHYLKPDSVDTGGTDFARTSYQDTLPRGYYLPDSLDTLGYGEGEAGEREHKLLRGAVEYVESQFPAGLNWDADGDGTVDMITFVVKGSPSNWGELLWPHRSQVSTLVLYLHGVQIWSFALMFESEYAAGPGTHCHEAFHVLGAPDLYHYDPDQKFLKPVSIWGLMESQYGRPQHMLAHMKERYGTWTTLPHVTTGGYKTLNPTTSTTNNGFRLTPFGTSTSGEHFVVEYRIADGDYERSLPDTGMLIYRVDPSLVGNAPGPPDEVYIYRPGGTLVDNGDVIEADYSADEGKFAINNLTSPRPFRNDNSDGNLFIADIGYVGNTISFFYAPNYTHVLGAIQGTWDSNLPGNPFVYWPKIDAYTNPGYTLNIESGTNVYFQPAISLRGNGLVDIKAGTKWTHLYSLGGYKRGMRVKGQAHFKNGGGIRLH